jgi:hypothetical protein
LSADFNLGIPSVHSIFLEFQWHSKTITNEANFVLNGFYYLSKIKFSYRPRKKVFWMDSEITFNDLSDLEGELGNEMGLVQLDDGARILNYKIVVGGEDAEERIAKVEAIKFPGDDAIVNLKFTFTSGAIKKAQLFKTQNFTKESLARLFSSTEADKDDLQQDNEELSEEDPSDMLEEVEALLQVQPLDCKVDGSNTAVVGVEYAETTRGKLKSISNLSCICMNE